METSLKLREGETFVLLLRHGIAEKKGIKPDAERELTPEGHERMERIGRTIARALGLNGAEIVYNPGRYIVL